jgi:hypothetical protein
VPAVDQRGGLILSNDTGFSQHFAMGDAAVDVIGIKAFVQINGGRKSLDDPSHLLRKSAFPEFFGHADFP